MFYLSLALSFLPLFLSPYLYRIDELHEFLGRSFLQFQDRLIMLNLLGFSFYRLMIRKNNKFCGTFVHGLPAKSWVFC